MRPRQAKLLIFLFFAAMSLAIADYREKTRLRPHIDQINYNALKELQERNHAPAEPWITELIRHTENIPYAQAQIFTDEGGNYEIEWQEFETREAFLTDREYEAQPEYIHASVSFPREWTFVKFQLDSSEHALDILHWIKENTSSLRFYTESLLPGSQTEFLIYQYWKVSPGDLRQIIVLHDGCLYLLRCENPDREGLEYINWRLALFRSENFHNPKPYLYEIDEEAAYWFDHESRLTTQTNPDRTFLEIQASALIPEEMIWRYGMLKEASYRIPISSEDASFASDKSNVSQLEIRLSLAAEIPEEGYFHEHGIYGSMGNVSWAPDVYIMEVWAMPGETLLQRAELKLNGASDDPLTFPDLNEDGFPDITFLTPLNDNGLDASSYWLWNPEKTCFEPLSRETIWQYQADNRQRDQLANGDSITVTVSEGDTLWLLAEKYYGSGSYYEEIYLRNREMIGPDPDRILPGTKLTFPPINDR